MYRSILIRLSAGVILVAPQAMAQPVIGPGTSESPGAAATTTVKSSKSNTSDRVGGGGGRTTGDTAKTTTVKSSKSNTSDRMGGGGGHKSGAKTTAVKEPLERAINLNSSKSNKY
jgi:hypothetical protein